MAEKIHERISADLPINSVVSIAIVDDPFSNVGEKIKVLRSTRDDPLAGMYARKYIDDAQLAAGRQWQTWFEDSEIGGVRAIDPTKEAVDGKRIPEVFTDRQARAIKKLKLANAELGHYGAELIYHVLGLRASIRRAAEARGRFSKHGIDKTGREFRNYLERLAVHCGFAGKLTNGDE